MKKSGWRGLSTACLWAALLAVGGSGLQAQEQQDQQAPQAQPKTAGRPHPKCTGSFPDQILGSYGTIWGHVLPSRGFNSTESLGVSKALLDYHLCRSVKTKQMDFDGCPRLDFVDLSMAGKRSLGQDCRRLYSLFQAFDFIAGHNQDAAACRSLYFKLHEHASVDTAAADALCARIAETHKIGMLCQDVPASAQCSSRFPESERDCETATRPEDQENCKMIGSLWKAISRRDSKSCPATLRHSCRAFLGADAAACQKADATLQATYCKAYAEAAERTKNQVGLTDETLQNIEEINRKIKEKRGSHED